MRSDYHVLFLLAAVTIASFSQILLKKGAMKEYSSFWRQYLNPWVVCGYGMMFLSVFLTNCALRTLAYFTAPMAESLGYVLVPLLSALFFKEKMTLRRSVGIGCIIAGVIIFYF